MTNDQVKFIHSLLAEGKDKWVDAANAILYVSQVQGQVAQYAEAKIIVRAFLQKLLDNDDYLLAATLLWGNTMFNVEPMFARRVFAAIHSNNMILLQGAGSTSKSYSMGAWMILDWMRDPYYTSIKVVSRDEKHLKGNLFAHIYSLLRNAAISLTDNDEENIVYREHDMFIGLRDAGAAAGFQGEALKHSTSSSGDLKGYKPQPKRKIPHPKFGNMTRLRVCVDEGQNAPVGIFTDFQSVKSSLDGVDLVKIVVAYNPESMNNRVVQEAEPPHGWLDSDLDTLYDWKSKKGWHVTRLDGARSENVIAKKKVFEGIQSYEGFMSFIQGDGADNSPDYYCADASTQCLTKRGWLGAKDLLPSDEIYTINPDTGNGEWGALDFVFNKHFDGELISMEGNGFSALVTENHRWPTTHKLRVKSGKKHYTMKETHELKQLDLIPRCAPPVGFPEKSRYSCDIASVLGWVFTDGSLQRHNRVVIYQSPTANKKKCDIIRDLLNRIGCPYQESTNTNGINVFSFSHELGSLVKRELGPEKKITMDLVVSLGRQELACLMEAMLLGDGGFQGYSDSRPVGTRYFVQKSEEDTAIFCAIATRLGFSTTTAKRFLKTSKLMLKLGYDYGMVEMHYATLRVSKTTRIQNMDVKKVPYHGDVWCPKTKNGTWLARRNGTVYFTGNTFGRGFPPIKGSANTIIPPSWPVEARGEPVWLGKPTMGASVDLAFQGADTAQMTVFKWGLAKGWRRADGKYEDYLDRTSAGKKKPRHVLEIHQIIQMEKSYDSIQMSEEIVGRCKMLGISPEWVTVDKMQPVSEPVLTPNGWIKIGEIKVGDFVIGSNGCPTKVTGVFPQTDRRVKKIVFNDGSFTRCGPEHLWQVGYRGQTKVVTTELIEDLIRGDKQRRVSIPMLSAPVVFNKRPSLPIDPYLLGVLIGDGNIRENSVRFASADKEIVDLVSRALPDGCKVFQYKNSYNFDIRSSVRGNGKRDNLGRFSTDETGLIGKLRNLGLTGKKSHEKFIPLEYMIASPEDRLALIQGLMDTDGYVQSGGTAIRLSNERLVNQIIEVVESLGGSGRVKKGNSFFGEKQCRDNYRATLIFPDWASPFRLSRKKEKLKPRRYQFNRLVDSISNEIDEDSVCIRVEAEDHLYVTRGHILTHNTGNGLGTFSHLTKYWGKVMGINWGDGATDLMVLSEDQEPASNRFQGISSEMWFAFREWLNPTVGAIVINPVVPTSPINVQLSSRRFRYAKNATMKVESKDEYKARNQRSCDEADSVIQCVQLVRTRGHVLPGMVEQADSRHTSQDSESVKQETVDEPDSICGDGNGKDNLEL